MRFFLYKGFARVSPVFVVGSLAAISLAFAPAFAATSRNTAASHDHPDNPEVSSSASAADPAAAARRQAATSQFARAEDQRIALNAKPAEKRSLSDYKQVVTAYRRVYLITPHATEVPDALVAVAELYTEMGDRFGRTYYQSAVDTYQFLIREYPKSKYLQDAYLRSAKLQKDQLDDTAGAAKTYDAFLKKFPRSKNRREAQEARAELALLENSSPPASAESAKPAKGLSAIAKSAGTETARAETGRADAPPPIISRDVPAARNGASRAGAPESSSRESGAKEVTNVASGASATLGGRPAHIETISARSTADSTRITIELEGGVQYESGRVANPDRIYFDFHPAQLALSLLHKKIQSESPLVSAIRVAQSPSGVVRVVLDVNGVKGYTASLLDGSAKPTSAKQASMKTGPARLVIDLYASATAIQTAQASDPETDATGSSVATTKTTATSEKAAQPIPPAKAAKPDSSAETTAIATAIPEPKRTLGSAKSGKKPDLVQPASAPQPTRDGNSTLTRALGLKIGRIVIDAGHGGHDTGTIGPTGLMEKDLCLDVALRLGKIIQQKLPGADVVFTRSDDTFIPLEERTHIANEAKADMFVSIHANSSQDSGARGIETYYLNLKGSPEAMEVAARENATSDQGIHELEDLVKQIARTEKIDESREFAEDVQESLSKRVQKVVRPVKDRGVRKAPFVVLIGADMPSILTEISFLSNPADEKLLKQPEHRQRVADGIFQGIAGYLRSLNSMGATEAGTPAPHRTTTSAASSAAEPSRNRN